MFDLTHSKYGYLLADTTMGDWLFHWTIQLGHTRMAMKLMTDHSHHPISFDYEDKGRMPTNSWCHNDVGMSIHEEGKMKIVKGRRRHSTLVFPPLCGFNILHSKHIARGFTTSVIRRHC
jgi:hypothetical protein